MPITLVLGGARSGKSAFAQKQAEALAKQSGGRLIYIATAHALDCEMAERIARHQADRGTVWHTIEVPLNLAAAIDQQRDNGIVLVDCLTLWLTNVMLADDAIGPVIDAPRRQITRAILSWFPMKSVGAWSRTMRWHVVFAMK